MTLTQLEYVVAVDNCRHFATAASRCFVTQPTLSMQIQKLEEELGIKIFDRSKQPVIPTEGGREIIEQAKKVLAEKSKITELVQIRKGILAGELRIGIIPTLAPYLLPLFLKSFNAKFPEVKLIVNEMMTEFIVQRLREGRIDVGLLVTPLQEKGIREQPLFYEELVAYVSRKNAAYEKTYVLAQDIDPEKLWLMEEGHCFRSQIVNLCELRKASESGSHFEYEAGSIETLRRMVDLNDGITILPELTTLDMGSKQQKQIRHFKSPAPMREVSMVTHRDFMKKQLIKALQEEIIAAVPDSVKDNKSKNVIPL
ncbi:hydrogen peroxide-inducible genes activator [Pollutibacter soli]|uniref:hydrogen peroxide-inducible genes activator n=1 Tax=Pollutibacter soli TaxID=3034157 RepID=UPI003014088E